MTTERNRDLIDCYLSGQISEQNWQQHLNEEPGLAYAWAARPRRCNPRVGDDHIVGFHPALCAPYGATGATERSHRAGHSDPMPPLGDSRRRISPRFPTIAEATVIRQRKHETIAARTLLVLMISAAGLAIYHQSWWYAGDALACVIGFVITCFVAGSRHNQGGVS